MPQSGAQTVLPAPAHGAETGAPAQGDSAPKVKAAAQAAGNLALAHIIAERKAAEEKSEQKAIEAATGVHIHAEYNAIVNKNNDAAIRFRAALPGVTSFINKSLAAAQIPIVVTEPELASNFLAEGGDQLVAYNVSSGIDGYGSVGIDTFMTKFHDLKQFLPPDLIAFAENKNNQATRVNEQGTTVHSITNLNMEQAMEANAAMYADAVKELTKDLSELDKPVDVKTLSPEARVFWITLYFNSGYNGARKRLHEHGVDWYKVAWPAHQKAPKSGTNVQHNGLVREGSFEMFNYDAGRNS